MVVRRRRPRVNDRTGRRPHRHGHGAREHPLLPVPKIIFSGRSYQASGLGPGLLRFGDSQRDTRGSIASAKHLNVEVTDFFSQRITIEPQ